MLRACALQDGGS
jgi:hypothetical protein